MEGGNKTKERTEKIKERDDCFKETIRTEKEESWSKRRKRIIFERLAKSRSLNPPKQNNIINYFAPEVPKDEPIMVESFMEEENREDSGKKTYARVDQHYKRNKIKYKRKCWYCNSWSHYKENCKFIRCFYCKRMGHIKANCWKRKIDWIYRETKERSEKKEREKRKKERRKRTKAERKKQLRIIENRANHIGFELKKTPKGEKFFMKWKDKEIGMLAVDYPPMEIPKKFRQGHYQKRWLFVTAKKETPLKDFTLYDGFSNWCSCGEIDLNPEAFISHVKRHHHGAIPILSQLNRPFWFDWVIYPTDEIERIFCTTLDEMDCLK